MSDRNDSEGQNQRERVLAEEQARRAQGRDPSSGLAPPRPAAPKPQGATEPHRDKSAERDAKANGEPSPLKELMAKLSDQFKRGDDQLTRPRDTPSAQNGHEKGGRGF